MAEPTRVPQTRLYTVDDYDRLPEDGRQFELIAGELIEKHGEGIGQDRSMNVADLDYLPAEGPRYEILRGVLFPLHAPDAQHQRTVLAFLRALDRFVVEAGAGEVIVSPPWVVLGEHDVALPDLVFVSAGRRDIVRPNRIMAAPDLVVEISMLPTIGRDLGRKNRIYRTAGVREYWTVNLVEPDVAVRAWPDGSEPIMASGSDGMVRSTILPGFAIDSGELIASGRGER